MLSVLQNRWAAACRDRRFGWRAGTLLVTSLFVGMALWALPAQAQHEVRGEVTDADEGTTLPGVNIVVKGTQTGTTTRSDGTYVLEVPAPTDTLVFSFVGYERTEVPVNGRSEIDVALAASAIALDEIVVNVGYGEQTVETTTGSVSQISGEDLEMEPTTNLTNALQGSVPGLIGVNEGGRPGRDGSRLLVRGRGTLNNNTPLVVIDGVPDRQGGLARLNPADIKSISVLKDATAAIYGARAANGVILVQTKRGRTGETRINVNVEQSWNQPTVLPELADASTYMQMLNEIDQFRGNPPRFSQEEIEEHRNCPADSYTCFNTDWFDVAFKDLSRQTTANASVTGGVENLRYRVSLRGVTENGIATNSSTRYNQVGIRSNLDGDVTDNFTISLDVHGRLQDQNYPTVGAPTIFQFAQQLRPDQPAFWPNGKPAPGLEGGINPVISASSQTGSDDTETYFVQSKLSLDVDLPVEGWSAEGTVAYDLWFRNRKLWQKPWTTFSFTGRDENGAPVLVSQSVGVPDPRLNQWSATKEDVLLRGTSRYETSVGSHGVGLLVGTEFQAADSSGLSAFRRFFPTDQIQQLFAGGQEQQQLSGTARSATRLNFFGRANYDYRQKYLLEFVARYDGSYIFPEGDRFGFFPSVSAGWRLAEEDWFDAFTNEFFDRLKLRASYGQTGNDRIEPYQFLRTFGFNGQFAHGDGLITRVAPTRVPNEDITWEVANQFDVGLEGAILDNRLTFDVSYFDYDREDILWFRSEQLPETAGFNLPRENIGKVSSWGVDGQMSYQQDVTSNISFRVGTNVSWAKDEIDFFAEAPGAPSYQRATGKPINSELYFIADGIWNTQEEIDNADAHWPSAQPGDIRFKDVNGDGQIDGDDRKRIPQNRRPDISGAVNLGLTVGSFNAQMQFQGAAKVNREIQTTTVGERGNFYQIHAENRWTPETKEEATWPRAYNRAEPYWIQNQNTFFLRDAKYLRLKVVRLGYTLPSKLTGQLGANRLQVYLTGRNLFTLSPLNLYDPEISFLNTYPPEQTFTVGIQLGF